VLFNIIHHHSESILLAVTHEDRIEVVGIPRFVHHVLVLDGGAAGTPSRARLGLELSPGEEH